MQSERGSAQAFRFRDRELSERILERIKSLGVKIKVMHVCGTHQDTLVRFGLEPLLEGVGVEVRQGPGCPVCVTTTGEIEEALALARAGKGVLTFGDMMKVPGATGSLRDAKAEGADVRVVYSSLDALRIAKEEPAKEFVYLGIGFETTAPSTAALVLRETPPNLKILSFHRLVPPALEAILEMGEIKLEGFIEPGHVSVIIGEKAYEFITERYGMPQVIAGFEPLDLLMATYMLAKMKKEGKPALVNEYRRAVRREGNQRALKAIEDAFTPVKKEWRGFPSIPSSALEIREEFSEKNARVVYEDLLKEVWKRRYEEPLGCRCPEVLRGLIRSEECPLFGKACTPENPVGPCMVSAEGSCNILYRYGRVFRGNK
ncbi:MAG: hydrogenase formation protein HypD [Thermoplasmata archaeon]|nr:MAG: hydrogenase formation protein HypD [Thermoplasmata archaeon]RLF72571.1 MAG: hydrogenase formation protein HypD [Thermoplasmata archaeon]HDD60274.1 hydrogenase formation protein HypD [Euryarchaeota archaeon]